jgi:hypothetical protein
MKLFLKRIRVLVFMFLTGYPINLLYGFVFQDRLTFDFQCKWIVPQLRRFEPHFSSADVCSANNTFLSVYMWLAIIAIYTVLFCVVCAAIYPRQLIELSRKLVSAKNASYSLNALRLPSYFIPLVFFVFLGLHFFRGFEFGRIGVTRPPESYSDILAYAQGQILFVHAFFGFWASYLIWSYVFELVVNQDGG